MLAFQTLLLILLFAVLLGGLARRIGAPFPTLLAVGGAALALSPVGTPLTLDPSLALALFVAPILLDAAYDTSVRDLKRNWRPIGGLVLVAVGLTTLAVAVVARALDLSLPWAAAITLGAIVSPPDAAAATSVLRSIRPPHRITVILEGESLLNDASALIVYKLAVMAALAGGTFNPAEIAPTFLLSVVASVIVGPLAGMIWMRVTRRIADVPSTIIVQFVGTFGMWVLAERFGLSPILTVVGYAFAIARSSPSHTAAQERVPSFAVWDTVVVVLNAVAFVLIGLQLGPALRSARPGELTQWAVLGGAVFATVVLIRLGWVMAANTLMRWRAARWGPLPGSDGEATWQGGLVIGWCGMRGIVTVATALALPKRFPHHDLILFVAFAVTLGTLVVQGLTLGPLVKALRFGRDDTVDREVRLARVALADVGLDLLVGRDDEEARVARHLLLEERRAADAATQGDGRARLREKVVRAQILDVRRQRLLDLRRDQTIGDDAFHRLEQELDFADLSVRSHL